MKKYTLSLLHLMIAIVCILLFKGCGSTRPEETTVYYPLIDTHLKYHKYKENIHLMIFPKQNQKLTQYCALHYVWDDITPIYRKINGQWKYIYRVNINKKSWK